MPIIPRGVAHPEKLAAAVADVEHRLAPDVVRIRYTVGSDWSGEQAIFFRILLSDAASRPDRLQEVTNRATALVSKRVDPLNSWGLIPYLKFRSQSEQAVLQEPAWA